MSSVDTTIQLIRAGKAAGTVCSPDLAEGPWVFDRQTEPSYGPGSSMGDIIPVGSPRQGQLPEEYRTASIQQLADRIHAVKQTLGECVVVLCGVCCMVETADILAGPPQSVILPNLAVGCSMADMADIADMADMADMADIDSVEEC